jgi:hypothetical protein
VTGPAPAAGGPGAGWAEIAVFLAAHAGLLARQGSVQPTWRRHRGRRLGPYYRLVYRDGGRQVAVYLGRDADLADAVRAELARLQAARRAGRLFARLVRAARAARRETIRDVDRRLRARGLYLKGYELRGGGASPPAASANQPEIPDARPDERRPAAE